MIALPMRPFEPVMMTLIMAVGSSQMADGELWSMFVVFPISHLRSAMS